MSRNVVHYVFCVEDCGDTDDVGEADVTYDVSAITCETCEELRHDYAALAARSAFESLHGAVAL